MTTTPPESVGHGPAVPAEVGSLAAQAGLGTHRFGYTLAAKPPAGWQYAAWVAAVLVFGGLFVFNPPDNTATQIGGALLLVVIVRLGFSLFANRFQRSFKSGTRLDLFDGGLVYTTKNETHVARYRDTVLQQRITRYTGSSKTYYRYNLRDTTGTRFTITDLVENPQEWGGRIAEQIAVAQFPQAWEPIQSGARLTFGDIWVSAQQLGCKTNTWPWSQVHRIDVDNGTLYLRVRDEPFRKKLADIPSVPNYPILLAVADRLSRSH